MSVEDVAAPFFDLLVKGQFACLYKVSSDGTFKNVLSEIGLTAATDPMRAHFGHLQKGHAIAFADFRGTGENDVFIELGGAYPGDAFTNGYFLNPGFGNRSIRIKLRGVKSNRDGIGAKIQVDFSVDGKARTVFSWINSGGSFGANPLTAHIGVGRADMIEQIKITWPATGQHTVLKDVKIDGQLIVVNESSL